ncbi:MAG: 3-deoxy-manno-octulosonate cytidylyltransferase [Acidobacteria bacterium]|nr:3-deoxy-manno-octulosonate cytidylyltransferase [Acidobacteriota bacterium]
MEHTRENPPSNVIAIIPARYGSTRLPGKMLLDVVGKPLIIRTLEQAKKAKSVSRVIVATDHRRIFDAVAAAGGEAVMTSAEHQSGSDRLAEVAEGLPDGSVIVNVQGDEPLISPDTIDKTVQALIDDPSAEIATACEPITSVRGELLNFNVVKVAIGEHGNALYFSRSPIPFPREASLRYDGDPNVALTEEPEILAQYHRKHTGLYAYRREYLLEFSRMPQTRLEKLEMLEQLRALENGARITVVEAAGGSIGVDTQADLDRVRALIMLPDIMFREASRDDIPQVAKVHVESWQGSFRGIAPDDYLDGMSVEDRISRFSERWDRKPYKMIVAEHPTGGIVGFADFGPPVLDAGRDAQIYSFYFLPQFQRLGLGGRLFAECVKAATEEGHRSLCLDSLDASPYRGFYEKQGGSIVGRDGHTMGGQNFETVIYAWDDLTNL